MITDSEIIQREKLFWTGSSDYYERWLARDVLMVFPAPAGILDRNAVLAGIRAGGRWSSIVMTDISVRRPTDSTVTIAYHARALKPDSRFEYEAFVGSVYVRETEEWKLAFHQHTPKTDPQNA